MLCCCFILNEIVIQVETREGFSKYSLDYCLSNTYTNFVLRNLLKINRTEQGLVSFQRKVKHFLHSCESTPKNFTNVNKHFALYGWGSVLVFSKAISLAKNRHSDIFIGKLILKKVVHFISRNYSLQINLFPMNDYEISQA